MKGVIMAGGEGTRLRPLTSCIPKPMVPIMNRPVMEHIINLLKKYNIKEIAVTMCYLPNVITDYFGNGESLGVDLKYYLEEVPLGTGGSVLNTQDFLDDTFVVISGDALTDIDLQKAVNFHREKGAQATLVLKKETIPLEYGIVIIDDSGRIIKFLEKPGWGEVFSDTINTGIYILEPEILDYYQKGDNFDFSKDLFPKLLKDNIPLFGYVADEYWNDIGDLKAYRQTHLDIMDKKVCMEIAGQEVLPGVFISQDTYLPKNVKIIPPVLIGSNCEIKDGVVFDGYTVLGDNCRIDQNSNISRSVIWCNSQIGKSNELRSTILCNNVKTQGNVNIYEESIVGAGCNIASGVSIKTNIKVWPNKNIRENTAVNRNLVWGTVGTRKIFGSRGIAGELNFEVTPELATLLGSAFGSLGNKEKAIIVSSDGTKSSNLLKECVAAGLLASGTSVIALENAITPMSRFAIRFHKAAGGIHISQNSLNPNMIRIEIFNENGGNIDRKIEKKIETLIIREDFKRGNADFIGDLIKVENFSPFYLQNNLTILDNLIDIKKSNFKIVIASPSGNEQSVVATYLKMLGCAADVVYPPGKPKVIDDFVSFVAKAVVGRNFAMGVVLSGSGEEMIIIDEKGNSISSEKFTLLASYVSLMSGICKHLIVPNTTTNKIEAMAEKYGAYVIRTKSSAADTINKLLYSPTPDDEYLFQYHMYFDVVASLGRIISYLVRQNKNINTVMEELPDFYMKKVELTCDFENRGRVISELIKQNTDKDLELFEGIRINSGDGWTLVLPDSEKPVFSIFSEGYTEEYAQELSIDISEKVKEIIGYNSIG